MQMVFSQIILNVCGDYVERILVLVSCSCLVDTDTTSSHMYHQSHNVITQVAL